MNRKEKINLLRDLETGKKKVSDLPSNKLDLSLLTTEELNEIRRIRDKYTSLFANHAGKPVSIADLEDVDGRSIHCIYTTYLKRTGQQQNGEYSIPMPQF